MAMNALVDSFFDTIRKKSGMKGLILCTPVKQQTRVLFLSASVSVHPVTEENDQSEIDVIC